MSEIDFNPFEVIEAITPKVTLGRKEYVAGRICFTLMFFIPPDGTFSIPTRMVEALARVRRDFPSISTIAGIPRRQSDRQNSANCRHPIWIRLWNSS